MADVNANINVNIDSSAALAQLKVLQRQISTFHTSIAKSSESAAIAQKSLQKNLLNSINSLGAFSAEMRTVKTTSEAFTTSLEKNKFSMREYFRYAGGATKTFGKLFKSEFDTIEKVATERVKRLQTQYIKLGRDTNGAMQAMSIMPTSLNLNDYATKTSIAAQKQALFNQLMKQGSTNLLNFGKNTQWAGRQLMVGFTVPLSILGTTATKTFMDMEAQALKFKKVYGDLFTSQEQTQAALDGITELARGFTQYGVAVSQTVGLAADAAAAGFQGIDLQRQTTEATRLSVLGQIDSQKALETTISLQNAFSMSSANLASSIDFLNAVENQTVVSLDDITTAIPKVAPVIQQLGGDVKDLTFFMAAMKEGGINASEGANALKSGLAALINPTGKANEMLKQFGINATDIVTRNKGNLKATVIEFAQALNQLDPLNRAQAIEQMFGKFQFARLSTLFANVTKEGNQAARVLALANSSVEDLSSLSEKELGQTAESAMNKFKKTVEDLKVALVPVGKAFLEAVTPIVEFVGNILEKFGNLSDGTKKAITLMLTAIGGLGPVLLMTFGLLANGVANIVKLFLTLRNGYLRLTGQSQILGEQTQYLTMEQIDAAAASHSLNQAHASLTQQFTVEAEALNGLISAYQSATVAGQNFMLNNPGAMLPRKYADGVAIVPGSGTGDTVPAMLTPGEAVIPAPMAKKYAPLIQGMIAGNIPGFAKGVLSVGGRAVGANLFNDRNAAQIQSVIDNMMNATSGVANAQTIIAETLARVSQDARISFSSFTKELDIVAREISNIQIPENIIGERDYSASGAGVKGSVSAQLMGTRGDLGAEEVRRAKVAADAVRKAYEDMGISGRKLEQALQVDRAHIVEVTQAEKRYSAAWDTRLFVAQARAENEMSMLLTNEKNQRAYISKLQNVDASESMKASILEKITRDLALSEEELQIQAQILKEMLADAQLMKSTTSGFGVIAQGTIAAAGARMSMGPASAGVGSRSAAEIAAAQQDLILQKFRGNTEFIRVIEAEGVEAIDQALTAMEQKAETRSPSKRTRRLGKNIVDGLRLGMQDGDTALKVKAEETANIATLSNTGGPVRPRTTISQLTSQMPISDEIKNKTTQQARSMQETHERLSKLNSAIMGGTFALTSLAGAGSLMGGAIGNASSQIMKFSGLLFGLMSVTQLLTQAKVAELLASRAALGASAAKSVGGTGFFSLLLRGAQYLKAFLGPIGLATAAIGVVVGAWKVYSGVQEAQRVKLEAFGIAVSNSTKQLKALGEYFGVTPRKTGFDSKTGLSVQSGKGRTKLDEFLSSDTFTKEFSKDVSATKILSDQEAILALKFRGLELLSKDFSKEQVQIIIDAIKEQAGKSNLDIDFGSIKFDEKSIISIQKDLQESFKKVAKGFTKKGNVLQDTLISGIDPNTGKATKYRNTVLSNQFQATIKNQANLMKTYLQTTQGLFDQGTISGETYNTMITNMFNELRTSVPEASQQQIILNSVFADMENPLSKAITMMSDYKDQLLLTQAAGLGLQTSISQQDLDALSYGGNDIFLIGRKQTAERKINSLIAERLKMIKEANAASVNDYITPTTDSGPKKKTWAELVKEQSDRIKSLDDQKKAMQKLTAAGVSYKDALDIIQNAEDAALIANSKATTAKIKGYAELIKKGREYALVTKENAKAEFDAQNDIAQSYFSAQEALIKNQREAGAEDLQNKIDVAKVAIDAAQIDVDAQQKLIDSNIRDISALNNAIDKNYDRPIQAINDESTILQNNLSIIDHQSNLINEKYDAQAKALDEVSQINEKIAAQEKSKLTIADAITQGDISAAAAAMQDARAQAANAQVGNLQDALDAAREAELARITVGGLTKAQIDEKLYQNSQEIFRLEQLRRIEQEKVIKLQDANYNYEQEILRIKEQIIAPLQKSVDENTILLDKYNKQTEELVLQLKYLGKTAKEWETNQIEIDAAYSSLITYNNTLDSTLEAMKLINAEWNKLSGSKQSSNSENFGFNTTDPTSAAYVDPIGKGVDPTNYGYTSKNPSFTYSPWPGFAKGGLVPRYFASGGFASGTDTIPSMLTPGEFVMTRKATSQYRPILESMNRQSFNVPGNNGYTGSKVTQVSNSSSSSVYNYNVGITVGGSNVNANEIAKTVIDQIRTIDSQRIRGQR